MKRYKDESPSEKLAMHDDSFMIQSIPQPVFDG